MTDTGSQVQVGLLGFEELRPVCVGCELAPAHGLVRKERQGTLQGFRV